MGDASETPKDQRIILVRSEVPPKYVMCQNCQAHENFRRHPSEGTGECRRFAPKGNLETLGASDKTYRAKWPITFQDEGCWEGLPKPIEKER